MNNLIFRRAVSRDMDDILQMELEVFAGEQKIPSTIIPLPAEKFPQWWCASIDTSMSGQSRRGKKMIRSIGGDSQ